MVLLIIFGLLFNPFSLGSRGIQVNTVLAQGIWEFSDSNQSSIHHKLERETFIYSPPFSFDLRRVSAPPTRRDYIDKRVKLYALKGKGSEPRGSLPSDIAGKTFLFVSEEENPKIIEMAIYVGLNRPEPSDFKWGGNGGGGFSVRGQSGLTSWFIPIISTPQGRQGEIYQYIVDTAQAIHRATPGVTKIAGLPRSLREKCKQYFIEPINGGSLPKDLQEAFDGIVGLGEEAQVDLNFDQPPVNEQRNQELYSIFFHSNAAGDRHTYTTRSGYPVTPGGDELIKMSSRLGDEINNVVRTASQQSSENTGKILFGAGMAALAFLPIGKVATTAGRAASAKKAADAGKAAFNTATGRATAAGQLIIPSQVTRSSTVGEALRTLKGHIASVRASSAESLQGSSRVGGVVGAVAGLNLYNAYLNGLHSSAAAKRSIAELWYAKYYLQKHLDYHDCIVNEGTRLNIDDEILKNNLYTTEIGDLEASDGIKAIEQELKNSLNSLIEAVQQGTGIDKDCPVYLPLGLGSAVCTMANFVLALSITITRFSFDLLLNATTLQ